MPGRPGRLRLRTRIAPAFAALTTDGRIAALTADGRGAAFAVAFELAAAAGHPGAATVFPRLAALSSSGVAATASGSAPPAVRLASGSAPYTLSPFAAPARTRIALAAFTAAFRHPGQDESVVLAARHHTNHPGEE